VRPNDYIGGFYKSCWSIIRVDLVAALKQIFELTADAWELLNSGNIALPKKDSAQEVGDYKLISLMRGQASRQDLCKSISTTFGSLSVQLPKCVY
jgi:hypothetical protein